MRVRAFGLAPASDPTGVPCSLLTGDSPVNNEDDAISVGPGGFNFGVALVGKPARPAVFGPAAPTLPAWPPRGGRDGGDDDDDDDDDDDTPLSIAAAYDTVFVRTAARIYATGAPGEGLTGRGGGRCRPPYSAWTPIPLPLLSPAAALTAVAVGERHAVALDSAGRVWCWGRDVEGQCSGGGGPAPVCVLGPGAAHPAPAVAAVAAGGRHTLALTADVRAGRRGSAAERGGTVFAWGWAARGQCGPPPRGSGGCVRAPTAVEGLGRRLPAPVTAVAAGRAHSLFLAGGGVYGCGEGAALCAQDDVGLPALITGGPLDAAGPGGDAVGVSAGAGHSAALMASGAVVSFGGDASPSPRTLVSSGATAVACGWWHTLVGVE